MRPGIVDLKNQRPDLQESKGGVKLNVAQGSPGFSGNARATTEDVNLSNFEKALNSFVSGAGAVAKWGHNQYVQDQKEQAIRDYGDNPTADPDINASQSAEYQNTRMELFGKTQAMVVSEEMRKFAEELTNDPNKLINTNVQEAVQGFLREKTKGLDDPDVIMAMVPTLFNQSLKIEDGLRKAQKEAELRDSIARVESLVGTTMASAEMRNADGTFNRAKYGELIDTVIPLGRKLGVPDATLSKTLIEHANTMVGVADGVSEAIYEKTPGGISLSTLPGADLKGMASIASKERTFRQAEENMAITRQKNLEDKIRRDREDQAEVLQNKIDLKLEAGGYPDALAALKDPVINASLRSLEGTKQHGQSLLSIVRKTNQTVAEGMDMDMYSKAGTPFTDYKKESWNKFIGQYWNGVNFTTDPTTSQPFQVALKKTKETLARHPHAPVPEAVGALLNSRSLEVAPKLSAGENISADVATSYSLYKELKNDPRTAPMVDAVVKPGTRNHQILYGMLMSEGTGKTLAQAQVDAIENSRPERMKANEQRLASMNSKQVITDSVDELKFEWLKGDFGFNKKLDPITRTTLIEATQRAIATGDYNAHLSSEADIGKLTQYIAKSQFEAVPVRTPWFGRNTVALIPKNTKVPQFGERIGAGIEAIFANQSHKAYQQLKDKDFSMTVSGGGDEIVLHDISEGLGASKQIRLSITEVIKAGEERQRLEASKGREVKAFFKDQLEAEKLAKENKQKLSDIEKANTDLINKFMTHGSTRIPDGETFELPPENSGKKRKTNQDLSALVSDIDPKPMKQTPNRVKKVGPGGSEVDAILPQIPGGTNTPGMPGTRNDIPPPLPGL